jgi:type IV secretion system protein VirB8
VRFQREVYDNASGATRPLDNRIATLEFAYKPELGMDEKDRIENPLGFQVTSYRVDNDYAPDPPLEHPDAARASATQPPGVGQAPVAGVVAEPGATEAAP